ncbi:MAG: AbiV family abortive infection protein [Mucilaginibacter sp.]
MEATKAQSSFRSLTSQQCLDIYEPVRQNARKHFVAAQLLAKEEDYANGVAHLILGTEELIKSAMLMLQGFNFPVKDIRNYDKLFYNHTPRHNLLKECYSIYLFVFNIVERGPKRNKQQSRAQHWSQLFVHGLQSAKEGLENYEWWSNAEKLKQNCFYVDYIDKGFQHPSQIGKSHWNDTHHFVSRFTVDLNELMIKVANATPEKLNEYLNEFEDAELNSLFSESINRKQSAK